MYLSLDIIAITPPSPLLPSPYPPRHWLCRARHCRRCPWNKKGLKNSNKIKVQLPYSQPTEGDHKLLFPWFGTEGFESMG